MDFLSRLPTFRLEPGQYRVICLESILGAAGFSVPMSVRVRSKSLGSARLTLELSIIFGYVFYSCLYVNKSYLMHATINGLNRLQLQHPVNNCNPLHDDCTSRFQNASQLPYCSQSCADGGHENSSGSQHEGTCARKNADAELCEYLDEYDIAGSAYQSQHLMVPTRNYRKKEKESCSGNDMTCSDRYSLEFEEDRFVADIESFTLLVDHSYVCPALGVEGTAWHTQGFIRPCGPPHDCQLVPIPMAAGWEGARPVSNISFYFLSKVWRAGAAPNVSDAHSMPYGDVFRIGYILDFLGIDLDKQQPFSNRTRRREGTSISLEVIYKNYVSYSLPNHLPVIYEYRFTPSAIQQYQATRGFRRPGKRDRLVTRASGVFVSIRTTGRLGAFSIRQSLTVLLETGLCFLTARWLIGLFALNLWDRRDGHMLVEAMADRYRVKDEVELERYQVYGRNRALST